MTFRYICFVNSLSYRRPLLFPDLTSSTNFDLDIMITKFIILFVVINLISYGTVSYSFKFDVCNSLHY